ncbi:phosphotyrosine protein [Punctularia strigosozonata HHB-11173 SS5]|uniref:phosphotyrosine protein n=1 Tax=Punctularia strigosozonata (strain HHB-11173) TaxID=741275 RepID=UPI00044181D9|nr:phosphotyrosine protein [Punctularia strigosozonata HHB-11173 SS5]EIN10884.1 phosphotyrosine protein [Punctularia strigosozonata HHB-11173 SS5]
MAPWKNVDPVIDGRLYVGNIQPAKSTRYLTEHRINYIVSVCTEPIPAEWPQSGVNHLRIPVEDLDYADLLIWLPTAVRFIHQALSNGGVVLVHSVQGLSRAPAVVAAYLMCTQRVNATTALDIVRRAREQIWVKAGLQEQLVLFEVCQYNPTPQDGIYRKWRQKITQHI